MDTETLRDQLEHIKGNPGEYFEDYDTFVGDKEIYLWSDDGIRWVVVCDNDDGDGCPYEIGYVEL